MIDSMIEIEETMRLLKATEKDENENPIDTNYKKLNTELKTLDKGLFSRLPEIPRRSMKSFLVRARADISFG